MKIKNCLIINSYAGSLVIAAQNHGIPILGSYEDQGYGIDIQKMNFPNLDYIENYKDWPKQNLSETIVLAHPPCAAFSAQASTARKRGLDSDKFTPTKLVMKYSMENNCIALAIESVIGAKEGARKVHDKFAKKYGYNVYRIVQNSIGFGLPQWRQRFWVIFIKKEATKEDTMHLIYRANFKNIQSVIGKFKLDESTTTVTKKQADFWKKQVAEFRKLKMSTKEIRTLLNPKSIEQSGTLPKLISKKFGITFDMAKKHCIGTFTTTMMRILHPDSFATTLLYDSTWVVNNRHLTVEEYCDIMGFPRTYKFGKYTERFREFLSRGVCPPVAGWILSTICSHLLFNRRKRHHNYMIEPGGELILKHKKEEFYNRRNNE